MGRYCPNRRGRGKYDTSRVGAGGVPGRPGCGRGDRPVPPGFSGVSAWRPEFVARAFSAGSGHCSICGPGNNDGRSRTPGHSPPPGKTVDVVALHGSASPRFRRAGTTATEHDQRGLNYRGWSVGSFGPSQKARWAANGRVLPQRPRPTRASALMTAQSLTVGADRSAVASMAPCLCMGPLPVMGVFTDSVEAPPGRRTTPGVVRPAR